MGAEQRRVMGMGIRASVGVGLVVALAWSYPTLASWGLAVAPEGIAGILDAALCFVPLLWAPLPAVGLLWMADA
jgi:hypothetical protein